MNFKSLKHVDTEQEWCAAAKQIIDHCKTLYEVGSPIDNLRNYKQYGVKLFKDEEGDYYVAYRQHYNNNDWFIAKAHLCCRNLKEESSRLLTSEEREFLKQLV